VVSERPAAKRNAAQAAAGVRPPAEIVPMAGRSRTAVSLVDLPYATGAVSCRRTGSQLLECVWRKRR